MEEILVSKSDLKRQRKIIDRVIEKMFKNSKTVADGNELDALDNFLSILTELKAGETVIIKIVR